MARNFLAPLHTKDASGHELVHPFLSLHRDMNRVLEMLTVTLGAAGQDGAARIQDKPNSSAAAERERSGAIGYCT